MRKSNRSPENWPQAFLDGFMQGVCETPRGYFAPMLLLWRLLRRGMQWWVAETNAIVKGQRP